MADKIFPEGIRVFNKRSNAPEWVKGSIVITPRQLVEWIKKNPDVLKEYKGEKQLSLDLLENKDNNLYLSVNTFQPKEEKDEKLPF